MKELNSVVAIPEDVPELGIKAGTLATVSSVYLRSGMLSLEVGREDGSSAGFVDVEVRGNGTLGVVGYSLLGEAP